MALARPLDIASPAFKAQAHEAYARLREEGDVCRASVRTFEKEAWLVLGYDDVAALLKDPRFAKDRANAIGPGGRSGPHPPKALAPLMRGMLDRDDPDHARLRRLVQKAFTPQRMEALGAQIGTICDELVNRIDRRGAFELIGEYALPVPVTVISELLGVPPPDRAKFAGWSKTIIMSSTAPLSLLRALPDMLAFVRYLRWLVGEKRSRPKDDLVSALVAVQAAEGALDDDELISMIALLLSAGHETTTNLIGNGVLALLDNPAELERLRGEPGLIESAVEELLRFTSPVETSTFRYAREDLEIGGAPIARGEMVLGVIASANRDERQFAHPHRLDLARTSNKHLSFGLGGHYCLGAPLARLEGRIALSTLLARFPSLSRAAPARPVRWRRGLVFRGLERLALRVV